MSESQSPISSIREKIAQAVEGKQFCDVGTMVDQLTKQGVFDEDFIDVAISHLKKDLVRQVMRRKGVDGYPLFPNIKMTDPDSGEKKQVYMREKYMRPPQYRQVSEFWVEYATYGKEMANETVKRCNKRYRTQWELPFPEPDEE